MTITVTKSHIDAGKRRSCAECPVALAIKDVVPIRASVYVDKSRIWIGYPPESPTEFVTPLSASLFIIRFDGGNMPADPFTFKLIEREV